MFTNFVDWLLARPDLTVTLATAIATTVGVAHRYRRTGRFPLASLPWRALRRLGYIAHRRFFTSPKPPAEHMGTVHGTLAEVRTTLGKQSYEPGWLLSYHYRGEDLNTRRYYYSPGREYPHRQLHVRGWTTDGESIDIDAHDEPSPLQHPKAHLREIDIDDATDWVTDAYNTTGLDPRGFR
ncbi:hypothetical protein [Haloarchaeobius sp. HRN-SO-5]|uniref:hypothetical protein n=1 Tax=Haloarchaeobius sp. HRN-SO-5 TaxID=3446118 RepID=UPI003EC0F07E